MSELVPKLRFGGFESAWQLKPLNDLCRFLDNKRIPLSSTERATRKGKYPYYGASGVIDFVDDYIFDGEFVLLGEDGANILMRSTPLAFIAKGKIWVNNHAHVLQAKGSNKFLAESLERIRYEQYNSGTAQPKLNADICRKIPLIVPELQEQQKIADFLTSVDTKISQLTEKHRLLQEYKKGVMQQIFSQQIRFKDDNGEDFPEWEYGQIDSFIERVSVPVELEKNKQYREIGIRSHGKGIFHKPPTTTEDIGNKRVFWVQANVLILNIVFAWERAIAVTSLNERGFIASHRFPMYAPKDNKADVDFLLYFFLSPKGESLLNQASPGGAGRNKTLGQSAFAKLKVHLPSKAEQQKIAQYLQAIDAKIDAVNQQIEQSKQFKKGLLQQMFV